MTNPSHPVIGLLLSQDLFFSSKITGTANALGVIFAVKNSPTNVLAALEDHAETVRIVVIDLSLPGLKIGDLIAGFPETARPDVIAYDAHVKTESLQAAQAAGCDEVLSRGQFSSRLPEILGRYT